MRVWLDPQKVAERKACRPTTSCGDPRAERPGRRRPDRRAARRRQPRRCSSPSTPQGRLKRPRSSATSSSRPAPNGAVVRLRDVARVELGASDYSLRSLLGQQAGRRAADLPVAGLQRHRRSPTTSAQTMDELQEPHAAGRRATRSSTTRRSSCAPRSRPSCTRCSRRSCWSCSSSSSSCRPGAPRSSRWSPSRSRSSAPSRVLYVLGFSINALSASSAWCWRSVSSSTTRSSSWRTSSATSRRVCRRARRRYKRDARGLRPDRRDRAGARRGVRAARLHLRPDRPVLPPVRADHRDLDGDLGDQLADAVAGAGRAAPAGPRRAKKDWLDAGDRTAFRLVLPRLQPGLRLRLAGLWRAASAGSCRRRRSSWASGSLLVGGDRLHVQTGARRLRAGAGQGLSRRLRAVARRREPRPHRHASSADGRHRPEAAGRRARRRPSPACRSTASPTAPMPASSSSR